MKLLNAENFVGRLLKNLSGGSAAKGIAQTIFTWLLACG
jgi:hypothetical protein